MRKVIWLFSILSVVISSSIPIVPSAYSGEIALVQKLQVQLEVMKKEQAELEAWLEKLSKYFSSNPSMLTEIGKFRSSYIESKSALRETMDKLVREGKEGSLR